MAKKQRKFKAEVQQLLELMIHSVYSEREVFLRELLSNAADAMDRLRFIELTESKLVPMAGDTAGIRITVDESAGTMSIEDDGIGMTEKEVSENLGTIARSGTRAFVEELKQGENKGAPNLIGQFGLGFYASFMVAEKVVVETRSAHEDSQSVCWISEGKGTFSLSEGTRESRGTSITLHLREDAKEFIELPRVKEIVRKYSNFLPWPVYVGEDQANSGKALWMERAADITDEEASEFYRSIAMDWQDPLFRVALASDSPLQYNALLFVPAQRPLDLFHPEADKGPRLYAKRVLIEEHAKGLIPDWLRFVKGVVDSQDISLNVSREMVQQTAIVRKIRDVLTKRILKELKKLSEETVEASTEEEDASSKETQEEKPARYATFWSCFGVCLKEGYYHDQTTWGDRIIELLRFNAVSHANDQGLISLAQYKEGMPEGQDTIWYLGAESREAALISPHLEAATQRGWDVLLMTDTVDEWLVNALTEYEGMPVKSITRGVLDAVDGEKKDPEEKEDLGEFLPWLCDVLGDEISEVRASNRLTNSACVLVDDENAMSANMERILRAANQDIDGTQRILEVNAAHPLVVNLAALHSADCRTEAEPLARLLLDEAKLMEGTAVNGPEIGRRLHAVLLQATQTAVANMDVNDP